MSKGGRRTRRFARAAWRRRCEGERIVPVLGLVETWLRRAVTRAAHRIVIEKFVQLYGCQYSPDSLAHIIVEFLGGRWPLSTQQGGQRT